MRKIDDTKEKIGVTKLDEGERKKLFKDLTDAGGKVISDTQTRPVKHGVIGREKQKEYKALMDERRNSSMKTESAKKTKKNAARSGSQNPYALDFFSNLKLRLRLRFFKICQSGCFLFHPKFIENLYGVYKTAIFEAKLQYFTIFKKNASERKRITAQLDSQNLIFFGLIEIMGEINDVPEAVGKEMNISELQQPPMEIFKTLLTLRPYENTLLNAYFKAIELCRNEETKRYPNQQVQKKMIKESLYIIFNELYPRLHWLMCHYYKRYIRLDDIKAVEELLDIDPIKKPENVRTYEKIEETQKMEQQSEAAEKAEEEQKHAPVVLSDEIRKGLEMMSEYDYDELRKEFDPKRNFESLKSNDKAFITILIYNEFIKEFSFILNTNKIKFFSNIGEVNHQSNLKDLYYEIDKPQENLKMYAASSTTYNQAKKEKPLSSSQYIAYTKRLQEISAKCESDGKNIRLQIKEYMEKLADEMKILLNDMDGSQTIIQNPQEILRMDVLDGVRKLNGKKVFEAINLCYCFASAFAYRLGARGDLSGDLEFSEEELATTKNKNDAGSEPSATGSTSATDSESSAAQNNDNSILNELDDFKDFKEEFL